jgi:hypothetical protein
MIGDIGDIGDIGVKNVPKLFLKYLSNFFNLY